MRIGIVGSEHAKFTMATQDAARVIIRELLSPDHTLVSGGCHLGGVDIYAEEEAKFLQLPTPIVHKPKFQRWQPQGYKARNIAIAQDSAVVHCLSIAEYPEHYKGMRFGPHGYYEDTPYCYHCNSTDHVKSGGCWTAIAAKGFGKLAFLHIIAPDGVVTKRPY